MGCDQPDTSSNTNKACSPQNPLPPPVVSKIQNQATGTSDDPIRAILETLVLSTCSLGRVPAPLKTL